MSRDNIMAQKILVMGTGSNDALLLTKLKEKYGEDIILVTPEEAKEQGLTSADFGNISTMKITAPLIMEHPTLLGAEKSGREKRRERRKKERNFKIR